MESDLNEFKNCERAVEGATAVFNLAANMGGMGFIENNKTLCMLSVLINTHLLGCSRAASRCFAILLLIASACVYNADKQRDTQHAVALRESDAYPALAEDGYGWEKLFSERMCLAF